jgi:hypothetical protein
VAYRRRALSPPNVAGSPVDIASGYAICSVLVAHDNFTRGAVRYAPWDVRVEQRDEPKISSRPTPSSGSMVRCGGGGEYERAFAGDQLPNLLPLFDRHGVQLRSRSSWAEPATNLHSGMVNRDPHELARHLRIRTIRTRRILEDWMELWRIGATASGLSSAGSGFEVRGGAQLINGLPWHLSATRRILWTPPPAYCRP